MLRGKQALLYVCFSTDFGWAKFLLLLLLPYIGLMFWRRFFYRNGWGVRYALFYYDFNGCRSWRSGWIRGKFTSLPVLRLSVNFSSIIPVVESIPLLK
jgi:hypothetical protein